MRRRPVTSVLLSSVLLAALAVAIPESAAAAAAAATPPPPPAVTGIEATAAYVPDVSCDPTAKPGATRFADLLKATYPGTSTGIGRACGSDGTVSEHYEGPFAFEGALKQVDIQLISQKRAEANQDAEADERSSMARQ